MRSSRYSEMRVRGAKLQDTIATATECSDADLKVVRTA